MQNSLFETPPEPGIYTPLRTPFEQLDLRELIDRFAPLHQGAPIHRDVWRFFDKTGKLWSVVATPWLVVAVRGHAKNVLDLHAEPVAGEKSLRREIHRCQHPETASRSTFARLREWAGQAQWPGPCPTCKGDGWHVCNCACEGQEPFDQCQECDGSCTAICQTCGQSGTTLPVRRARLEKSPVNANLVACALEILAPAISEPMSENIWGWRDDEGRVPCLRLEADSWRMIVMPLQEEI